MISQKLQSKFSENEFKYIARYLGISIHSQSLELEFENQKNNYIDIDHFFLASTYNLHSSRLAEGILCWLLRYGHLLSPSKIRRLILAGCAFDQARLGGLIEFMNENKIKNNQWKIVKPFCKRVAKPELLLEGPPPRLKSKYFLKYGLLAPQFQLDQNKFLLPTDFIFKNCIELRNRALFGSVVNADVASFLQKRPGSTAYEVALNTYHHKARVFEIFNDVKAAAQFKKNVNS